MSQSSSLYRMFNALPSRYDLVNHVITWNLDRRWRRLAAQECLATQPKRVLDLGCGTGGLAINLARLARGNTEIFALDFSPAMLEIAKKKAEMEPGQIKIRFTQGEATTLPYPDGYFDCVGISFAFRNLTYKNPEAGRHIAEIVRVLRPGGRCVIVESSQPKQTAIRKLFHLYLRWFVTRVGHALSGNRGAYYYLAESAARFYNTEEVREMLLATGFRQVSFRPLLSGVAGIHVAVK